MGVVVTVLLAALVKKFVDFARQVRAGASATNAVATQLLAWLAGIILVLITAHTGWAGPLADLGFWTQLLTGLGISSLASVSQDFLAALDSSRTSKVPPLVPTAEAETKP